MTFRHKRCHGDFIRIGRHNLNFIDDASYPAQDGQQDGQNEEKLDSRVLLYRVVTSGSAFQFGIRDGSFASMSVRSGSY